MFKRTVLFAVVFMLLFSTLSFAVDVTQEQEAAGKSLVALGILTGYADGSLKLDNQITRAEFATLAVRLILKEDQAAQYKKDTIFKDVTKKHWASGYVNIAVAEGLVNGYPDGTFKPENNISHSEILAVLVRLLGYENTLNPEDQWPANYINKANSLGINKDGNIDPNVKATRGQVFVYTANSLLIKLNKNL